MWCIIQLQQTEIKKFIALTPSIHVQQLQHHLYLHIASRINDKLVTQWTRNFLRFWPLLVCSCQFSQLQLAEILTVSCFIHNFWHPDKHRDCCVTVSSVPTDSSSAQPVKSPKGTVFTCCCHVRMTPSGFWSSLFFKEGRSWNFHSCPLVGTATEWIILCILMTKHPDREDKWKGMGRWTE